MVNRLIKRARRVAKRVVGATSDNASIVARRNKRWWELEAEASRIGIEYSVSVSDKGRVLVRAALKFSKVLGEATAANPTGVASGKVRLVRQGSDAAKRSALDLAEAALAAGARDFAKRLLEELTASDPKSRAAWGLLASAYLDDGDLAAWAEARAKLAKFVSDGYAGQVDLRTGLANLSNAVEHHAKVADDGADAAQQIVDGMQSAMAEDARFEPVLAAELVSDDLGLARTAEMLVRRELVHGPADLAGALTLADAYGELFDESVPARVGSDVLDGLEVIDVSGFRDYVAGKSVCLLANSQTLASSGLGERIDSYDVVVRFNSFVIDPVNTGTKTSIHALIHLHDFNWEVPVDVRLVFSGDGRAWRRSVVKNLRPGAQRMLADESLRWPVKSEGLAGEVDHPGIPTSGFNMLRLLDLLDVSPMIDLIGFDFNQSGPFRLAEAMDLPIAAAHEYPAEEAWVMQHAVRVDGPIISLR